jgi:hypothetical protein
MLRTAESDHLAELPAAASIKIAAHVDKIKLNMYFSAAEQKYGQHY